MSNSCIGIVNTHNQVSSYSFKTTEDIGLVTGIHLQTTSNQLNDNVEKSVLISIDGKSYKIGTDITRLRLKLDFIVNDVFYEVKYDNKLCKYEFIDMDSTKTTMDADELYHKLMHLIYNVNKT